MRNQPELSRYSVKACLSYRLLLLLALLVSANQPDIAQEREPELARLQNDFAMYYLEPEPHMVLAKYYLEHGQRLEAFYTLEAARRERFEETIFDRAFQKTFSRFDNSQAAEKQLLIEHATKPDSVEVLFQLADIYISRSDWTQASDFLLAAIEQRPDDFRFISALSEVLRAQEKFQEADRLIQDYARRYPESRQGYALRAEALAEKNPDRAKLILSEGLTKFPDDGYLFFQIGRLMQRSGDLQKAEAALVKAAALAPNSVDIQAWVGRFFFKVKKDNERALEYYLKAYFLSPHAYESEFVESRIRQIAFERARVNFENQLMKGQRLTKMIDDPDPNVVLFTLEEMRKKWLPSYLDAVTALMGHDDQAVRWEATQVLKTKVDDSFDERLRALLKSRDLRQRGLAAYIAVYRWKGNSFGIIDELLHEQAELLRFDAISALILEGGDDGKRHAFAHAAQETNPTLKKLIEASRAKDSPPP